MRWTRGPRSPNIEDRRGQRVGVGGKIGIGTVAVVLLVALARYYLGVDLGVGSGGGGGGGEEESSGPPPDPNSDPERDMVDFVSFVIDDLQATWPKILARGGVDYRPAKLVLFRQATRSSCGYGTSAMGPFYCPGDQRVYIDLSFYELLKKRFGAPGDFAQAYVIAHEVGHHVQNLLGYEKAMRAAQQRDPERTNELSVRFELQADCLAGVWGHTTKERNLLDPDDIDEGLRAAAAIGDDTLQKQAGGKVSPESWTHGSSEQRARWLRRGLEVGTVEACDTTRGQP